MRPIERGKTPQIEEAEKLADKEYKQYADARPELIHRIGQYCSFCNRKIPASLAVEHVQPKSLSPLLEREWTNFLLACTNCNSIKSDKAINNTTITDYYLPHINNTHLAFTYEADGNVSINAALSTESQQKKAQNTLDLVGLQRYIINNTASDLRWQQRKECYEVAVRSLSNFKICIEKGVRAASLSQIIISAQGHGHFSIWFSIFNEYDDVKAALITAFSGTADCFDKENNYKPLQRVKDDL